MTHFCNEEWAWWHQTNTVTSKAKAYRKGVLFPFCIRNSHSFLKVASPCPSSS